MKTLLFTLEYPPWRGGVANYYGNLVKYWPETGGIKVLNNNDRRLINDKLPLLKWLPAYSALRQEIIKEKIKHVLVGQILPLGAAALICSKFYKIKYSVILHGLDFTYAIKTCRKKFLSRIILIGAKRIICANSYLAKTVKHTFPNIAQKIQVVNPGVENYLTYNLPSATRILQDYNLKDKVILLSVGRLIKRKGFDKVIEAMPAILKQKPNFIYVIIGAGSERKNFKFKILNLKLKNNVLIINQATDDERDCWYNLCDIFIMPARNIDGDFEGFGIVYLEANLAGKPVIAGQSGGVSDAVVDGLNGLLVDPEDNKEIIKAVVKLAANPDLAKELGRQGKERAINDFSWKKQAGKIYKSII